MPPRGDGDLSDFMRWVTLTHTQRYHVSHGTVGMGHLYQGRYKSFPVQDEGYYLTALRYIEGNPVRAALVQDAGELKGSGTFFAQGAKGSRLNYQLFAVCFSIVLPCVLRSSNSIRRSTRALRRMVTAASDLGPKNTPTPEAKP